MDEVIAALGVGDIIKTTRTHKVYSVLDNGVGTEDVQTGVRFWIGQGIDHGSLKVELVKKAKPKVKVGDVLRWGSEDLPVGTVVTDNDGVIWTRLNAGSDQEDWSPPLGNPEGYISDDSCFLDRYQAPLKVIYLP